MAERQVPGAERTGGRNPFSKRSVYPSTGAMPTGFHWAATESETLQIRICMKKLVAQQDTKHLGSQWWSMRAAVRRCRLPGCIEAVR